MGGSAQAWSLQPSVTRFATVVMLTPLCPTSENFAAPIHADQPSEEMSKTTRSEVNSSPSGSMKYLPGSRAEKCWRLITSCGDADGTVEGEGLEPATWPIRRRR